MKAFLKDKFPGNTLFKLKSICIMFLLVCYCTFKKHLFPEQTETNNEENKNRP